MSDASAGTVEHEQPHSSSAIGLMVGAVGVCYGDIGTSPLYTLKEVFIGGYGVQANHDGVLGVKIDQRAIALVSFGHEKLAFGIPMRIRAKNRNLGTDVVARLEAALTQNMRREC